MTSDKNDQGEEMRWEDEATYRRKPHSSIMRNRPSSMVTGLQIDWRLLGDLGKSALNLDGNNQRANGYCTKSTVDCGTKVAIAIGRGEDKAEIKGIGF